MKKAKALGIVLLVLGIYVSLCSSAWAQTVSSIPMQNPSLYKGVRPLGMGNAFVAMPGSDENAPFYNPAAINDYPKKLHFRLLSPVIDFSPSVIGLTKDVLDLGKKINGETTTSAKVDDFRAFVDAHTGEFESIDVRLPLVQVQHRWFSASVLADSRTSFAFRNRSFTNLDLLSISDVGGTLGAARSFLEGRLQTGLNVKVLHRIAVDKIVTTADIINNAKFKDTLPINRGTGVGFDIGFKGSIPTFGKSWLNSLKPTAGFTWQDVGNTRFSGLAPNTPQSITIGLAVHPEWGKWTFHVANDFRELNQDSPFLTKWHIGAEAVAPKIWKIFRPSFRVGGNQAYISGGASLDFKYAKLEFATYAEDVGKVIREKPLRRIAANLSFGF